MTTDTYDDSLIELAALVEIAKDKRAAFEGISVAELEQRSLAEKYVRLERWYTCYPDFDSLSDAQQLALTIADARADHTARVLAQRSVAEHGTSTDAR